MDREKVIKEFEYILNEARGDYLEFADITVDFGEEILAMLKEHEPIAPSVCGSKEPDGHGCWRYLCGKCKKPIDYKDRFCKRCGQAVKWDG